MLGIILLIILVIIAVAAQYDTGGNRTVDHDAGVRHMQGDESE